MFEKYDFTLMHSPNLDQFQLIALASMRIVFWSIEWGKEEGE
jgi:hypothetical protein